MQVKLDVSLLMIVPNPPCLLTPIKTHMPIPSKEHIQAAAGWLKSQSFWISQVATVLITSNKYYVELSPLWSAVSSIDVSQVPFCHVKAIQLFFVCLRDTALLVLSSEQDEGWFSIPTSTPSSCSIPACQLRFCRFGL